MATDVNGQPTNEQETWNRVSEADVGLMLRKASLGDLFLGTFPQHVRKVNFATAAVSPGSLATVQTLVLPDSAKASFILRATARAGAGTPGELVSDGYVAAAPAAGHVAIGPNGNIVALIADGWTDVDFVYIPERGVVVETVLPVQSNALVLPASWTTPGAVLLLEAEAVAATLVGNKIVLIPGTAPAAGQARLNVAKTQVLFQATDAVTRARVKVLIGLSLAQSIQGMLAGAPVTV